MTDKILWRDNALAQDSWTHAETVEGEGQIIVPLAAYLALSKEERKAGANRLGVLLAPLEALDAIVEDLPNLSLVALAFPSYTNGTSHSKASMLVEKHGFSGEIRAVGDVLFDQIPLMIRNGFTSFEIVNAPTISQLTSGKHGGIPLYYQPAAKPSGSAKSYAWRHKEAS
jgi:uncharacterized protein (DUF934 family)